MESEWGFAVGIKVEAKKNRQKNTLGEVSAVDSINKEYTIKFVDGSKVCGVKGEDIVGSVSEEQYEQAKKDQILIKQLLQDAQYGNTDEVVKTISTRPDLINGQNANGYTPLIVAAEWRQSEIVETLIKSGADLEARNNAGRTALIWSCIGGGVEVIEILLSGGADIEASDNDECTSLLATREEIVVKLLLQHNCDVNKQDKHGRTALIIAIEESNMNLISLLLAQPGIDLNLRDKYGDITLLPKPLSLSSSHPHLKRMDEYTVIHIPEAVGYNLQFDNNCSLFKDSAYDSSRWSYIRFYKDDSHTSIWGEDMYSGGHGDHSRLKSNYPGIKNIPPLHIPVSQFIMYFHSDGLLKPGWGYLLTITPVYITDKNKTGWTALMWASYKGYSEIVSKLLSYSNIEKEIQGWNGNTALGLAIEKNHESTGTLLVEREVKLYIPDKKGITPIEKAIRKSFHILMKQLISSLNLFLNDTFEFLEGAVFIWITILSTTSEYPNEITIFLDSHAGYMSQLVSVQDEYKRPAIGLARYPYRTILIQRMYLHSLSFNIENTDMSYATPDEIKQLRERVQQLESDNKELAEKIYELESSDVVYKKESEDSRGGTGVQGAIAAKDILIEKLKKENKKLRDNRRSASKTTLNNSNSTSNI